MLRILALASLSVAAIFVYAQPLHAFGPMAATTTVLITICGNAIVEFNEVCDLGSAFNDGAYSTSTIDRHCAADCQAFAPYCGDQILSPVYGESCDDGNNVSGDNCTDLCVMEIPPTATTSPPPSPPPQPGGPGEQQGEVRYGETKVVVSGKAYPSAIVHILRDGTPLALTTADADADFEFQTDQLTGGPTTFGFWAEDDRGLRSLTFTTTFQVVESAITTLAGIFLPPTIQVDKNRVSQGTPVVVYGQTVPHMRVLSALDGSVKDTPSTTALASGHYTFEVPTATLKNNDFHNIKTLFDMMTGSTTSRSRSGYSQSVSFYLGAGGAVGTSTGMRGDINNDNRVNLIDFSVLLFYWGAANDAADLNSDGIIGLPDFSILLFNWTG